MRTTIQIDDDLLAKAVAYSGIEERGRLVSFVFEKHVQREAAKHLKSLASKAPDSSLPPRSMRYEFAESQSSFSHSAACLAK